MKQLNQLITAAMLCLVSPTTSHAQTFHIGPSANWLHNMPSGQDANDGFSAGAIAEMNFANNKSGWFVDAGIMFEKKKWDSNTYLYYNYNAAGQQAPSNTWHYTTYGMKIPVNIGYKLWMSKAVKIYAAAGPYLSIGIAGKERLTTNIANGLTTDKVSSGNVYKDGIVNRTEWGLGVKMGAELLGNYHVTLSYDHAMSNIFKKQYMDAKSRTLSIGIGYLF